MLCRKNVLFCCILLLSCTTHTGAPQTFRLSKLFLPTFVFRHCRPETTRLERLNRKQTTPRIKVMQQCAWQPSKASPIKKNKSEQQGKQ